MYFSLDDASISVQLTVIPVRFVVTATHPVFRFITTLQTTRRGQKSIKTPNTKYSLKLDFDLINMLSMKEKGDLITAMQAE